MGLLHLLRLLDRSGLSGPPRPLDRSGLSDLLRRLLRLRLWHPLHLLRPEHLEDLLGLPDLPVPEYPVAPSDLPYREHPEFPVHPGDPLDP